MGVTVLIALCTRLAGGGAPVVFPSGGDTRGRLSSTARNSEAVSADDAWKAVRDAVACAPSEAGAADAVAAALAAEFPTALSHGVSFFAAAPEAPPPSPRAPHAPPPPPLRVEATRSSGGVGRGLPTRGAAVSASDATAAAFVCISAPRAIAHSADWAVGGGLASPAGFTNWDAMRGLKNTGAGGGLGASPALVTFPLRSAVGDVLGVATLAFDGADEATPGGEAAAARIRWCVRGCFSQPSI